MNGMKTQLTKILTALFLLAAVLLIISNAMGRGAVDTSGDYGKALLKDIKSENFTTKMSDPENTSHDAEFGLNPLEVPPGSFMGDSFDMVYHLPSCSLAQKIPYVNQMILSSPEVALNKGYRPCSVCRPPTSNDAPGIEGGTNWGITTGAYWGGYGGDWL